MSIIGVIAVAFVAVLSISIFYKTPTCSDGVQNQGEASVDCGGPCPYLCTDQVRAPTVLFTQAIDNGNGRVDIVASIENRNATAAAKNVPYTATLYTAQGTIAREISGVLDLPPSATVPLYLPGVLSGVGTVTRAFLTIDPSAPA